MSTKNSISGRFERAKLAGVGARLVGDAGVADGHGAATVGKEAGCHLGSVGRAHAAPAFIAPDRLAEALAVMLQDLLGVLPVRDRGPALEQLANKLDDRGRTANGTEAAALLGAVGGALMRMEG